MIYVSKPAIISAAGADAEENFVNLCGENRFLSVCEGFRADKSFILGKISAQLAKFSQNTPKHLQTRTNALVLSALLQIDKDVRDAIKKYGKNRDGINIGEGAAFFVASRDEISNVVIAGEHSNCDAFHMTQPDFSGQMQTKCVQKALQAANLSSVDYINLHGTGTQANDKIEAKIVHSLMPSVFASSVKPLIGHTLGAAGAIESALCAMLCAKGETALPPHVYDGVYDDEIEGVNLVKFGQRAVVNSAMSLSFAFGGDNAAIVFGRAR